MTCSIDEQKLYLLSDGLLDEKERAALLAHCASCPRCAGILEEARRSLSLFKQPVPDTAFLPQEKELSIISGALEQAAKNRSRKPRIIAFRQKEYLFAAAAALVILSVVSGVFLLGPSIGKQASVSTTAGQGNRVAELTKDTTSRFNRRSIQPGLDDSVDFPRRITASATNGTYGKLRALVRRGDYEKAIAGITRFLSTNPRDPDVAYCDLALCYCKTDQWDEAVKAYSKAATVTKDELVREAILHRTNHILYSKLFRYNEAAKGVRTYLVLYPHGAWRERELELLARVERASSPMTPASR
jgi:tetratricopeptide (TPR) repeat protein